MTDTQSAIGEIEDRIATLESQIQFEKTQLDNLLRGEDRCRTNIAQMQCLLEEWEDVLAAVKLHPFDPGPTARKRQRELDEALRAVADGTATEEQRAFVDVHESVLPS